MSQHPPGFTRYIGLDEHTNERIFAVMSSPTLLPPISHARLIAKVPEMYEFLKYIDSLWGRQAGAKASLDDDRTRVRALLREIEGQG